MPGVISLRNLLELSGTEGKVAGGDFVAERFTNLCNAEWEFLSGGTLDICKVDKDALCSFRTQINLALCILGNALEGLEHQVELADIGEVGAAAVRAFDAVFLDEVHHLLVAPAVGGFAGEVLNQLIRTVTGLAVFTVHERVRKSANMTGSDPNLRVHQDGAVQADIVWALLNKAFPPCAFNIVFQLYTKRTIIPGVGETAVDFGTSKNEASALAQSNDFFHGFFS